ncbi:hypothetical protein GCM10022381_07670 [Leifsonia kafniensis]|uniref:DUF4386 family protein n=1 Tax=Leifsonia kafniensis TaxID=475957 RepID=A0ABP7K717_9MICO
MPNVMRDAQMAWVAFAVAVLGIVASVMLLLMFATEVPYNGPYRYGAAYETLTAVANALTAALVLYLSHLAGPSRGARVFAPVLAVLLVVGAGSAILLVTHVVGYAVSTAVTIAVLFLEGVWMIWLNRRMRLQNLFPASVSTIGWLIGVCLVIGLPLGVLGFMLPPLHIVQLLVLGAGIFIAGAAWVIFAVWWVLVGVWLLRGRRPALGEVTPVTDGAADGAPGATTRVKERGRRKA